MLDTGLNGPRFVDRGDNIPGSGQPSFTAAIVLYVAKTDAFALADAEVKFLDVGIFTQFRRAAVEHHAAILENIAVVCVTQCDIGILLGQQKGNAFILVQPFDNFEYFFYYSNISSTNCGASPIDGSSSSIICGRDISARPIAIICCSPPEV